jgi:hypothetical protein
LASWAPALKGGPRNAVDDQHFGSRAISDLLVGKPGKLLVGQQHRIEVLGNDQARRSLISELRIERLGEGFEEVHPLVEVFTGRLMKILVLMIAPFSWGGTAVTR